MPNEHYPFNVQVVAARLRSLAGRWTDRLTRRQQRMLFHLAELLEMELHE